MHAFDIFLLVMYLGVLLAFSARLWYLVKADQLARTYEVPQLGLAMTWLWFAVLSTLSALSFSQLGGRFREGKGPLDGWMWLWWICTVVCGVLAGAVLYNVDAELQNWDWRSDLDVALKTIR